MYQHSADNFLTTGPEYPEPSQLPLQLEQKKARLEAQLAEVNEALVLLGQNPEMVKIINILAKTALY